MATKPPAKKTTTTTAKVRKRKVGKYKSFRLAKRIPHPSGPLPSAWSIFTKARRLLWKNKKPLLWILALYLILNLVLVRGFASPLNVTAVKNDISQSFGKSATRADTTAAIFAQLIGSNGQTPASAGIYQAILLIVFGMALIWIFRQSSLGKKPTAKQALYNGMYPLIPLLLVIFVMFLQCLPAILGSDLYSATVTSGVASTGLEKAIWILLSSSLGILTLYMLFSSIFALFVVTLPDMTPMKALRSARQLVFSRRLNILRKLIFLPLLFVLVLALILVPAIYFVAPIAPWLYFILTILSVIIVDAYLFCLYKELL